MHVKRPDTRTQKAKCIPQLISQRQFAGIGEGEGSVRMHLPGV